MWLPLALFSYPEEQSEDNRTFNLVAELLSQSEPDELHGIMDCQKKHGSIKVGVITAGLFQSQG